MPRKGPRRRISRQAEAAWRRCVSKWAWRGSKQSCSKSRPRQGIGVTTDSDRTWRCGKGGLGSLPNDTSLPSPHSLTPLSTVVGYSTEQTRTPAPGINTGFVRIYIPMPYARGDRLQRSISKGGGPLIHDLGPEQQQTSAPLSPPSICAPGEMQCRVEAASCGEIVRF